MIIKGQARGRSRQLAAHLLRTDQNETVRLFECRGTVAKDVESALVELEAYARAVNTKRPLYHASISPEAHVPFDDEQIRVAADVLENKLGFGGQPRIIVVHSKEGREHVHIVWSRLDLTRGRLIADSWNYLHHEEAARELEARFGHRAVQGAIYRRGDAPRPRRTPKNFEYRQAERSGLSIGHVTAELAALWYASDDGRNFQKRLQDAGYTLARGDRRAFVVIDRAGGVHSLARRCGVRPADLRLRFADLGTTLPCVAEARGQTRQGRATRSANLFKAVSREVVGAGIASHSRRTTTARVARAAFADAVEPKPQSHGRAQPLTITRHRVESSDAGRYRAARSLLIAAFAAKIAAARREARPDEIEAMLAALYAERDAALDALAKRSDAGTRRRGVGPRKARQRPRGDIRLRRFARRRRRKPPGHPQ